MLRSLGLGLGLETFAKFLRVSVLVSKNLVSEKSLGFGKFGIVKKVSVSVSVKILVSSFSAIDVAENNWLSKLRFKRLKKSMASKADCFPMKGIGDGCRCRCSIKLSLVEGRFSKWF